MINILYLYTIMIIFTGTGRFGNIFIRNFVGHLLYDKNIHEIIYEQSDNDFNLLNIKFNSSIDELIQLKINKELKNICKLKKKNNNLNLNEIINITDINIHTKKIIQEYFINKYSKKYIIFIDEIFLIDLINNKIKLNKDYVYICKNIFCQRINKYSFILKIIQYINNIDIPFVQNIINNNKFKNRYNNNNDIFIHIRSGDIYDSKKSEIIPTFNYYKNIINNLKDKYSNIYICSNDKNNNIIKQLKNIYNITYIEKGKIENILFGSTCRYIIMSGGSYSFLFGLLSFYSKKVYFNRFHNKIYNKKLDKYERWYPDYYIEFLKFNKKKYILCD